MTALNAAMMPEPSTTCEVQTKDGWLEVDLREARARYTLSRKRCPACHGSISLNGTYVAAPKLSMAHRRGHTGCPFNTGGFSGEASPHPKAVA